MNEAQADALNWCNLCTHKEYVKTVETAGFLHTQEVRGSSPCAPTIYFQRFTRRSSSNSGPLLFGQVVSGVLRDQALRLLHFSSATLIDTSGSVAQKCSRSRGILSA